MGGYGRFVKNLCEVVHTSLFIISTWELICEPMKIERCMNSSHQSRMKRWGPASGHLRSILDRCVGAKANDPQKRCGSLMPPAGAYVSVVHGDSPPSPIELAHHADTNAGTFAQPQDLCSRLALAFLPWLFAPRSG